MREKFNTARDFLTGTPMRTALTVTATATFIAGITLLSSDTVSEDMTNTIANIVKEHGKIACGAVSAVGAGVTGAMAGGTQALINKVRNGIFNKKPGSTMQTTESTPLNTDNSAPVPTSSQA